MKRLINGIFAILVSVTSFAQLTGTKTVPGDYATVASAIAALNSAGVGAGGVVFSVAAGHTETFPTPTAGFITTLTGSMTTPISFIKSGTGANPLITAAAGKGDRDAIIAVNGCDYVTFNHIDLEENSSNSTPDGYMEWGFAILKSSGTNGSQNITIQNCTISLNSGYTASIGVYSGNHTSGALDQLTVTDLAGTNSRLKIFSNTINNCYTAISLNGYNDLTAPYANYDQDNEIGKDGGNTITNVAGSDDVNGYGIFTQYQNTLKVANNTVSCVIGGTGRPSGIYLSNATNGSFDLYGNTVSIQYWGNGSTDFYPIYSEMGAYGFSNVVNVYNNTVSGCTYPTFTSAYIYPMYLRNLGVITNVYGNMITNNEFGDGGSTATGRVYYLFMNKISTTMGPINVHDNVISGNTRTQSSPGGGLTMGLNIAGKGTVLNCYNNTITNNALASNGGSYLLNISFDMGERYVYNNVVSDISRAEGVVYALYNYNVTGGSGNGWFYNNKVTNIQGTTSGSNIYGIYNTASASSSYFYNNMVSDLRTISANTTGISLVGFFQNQGALGLFNNTVYLNCTSTGSTFNSSAFYSANANSSMDLRSNILVNTSTPKGTGKSTAIRLAYTNYLYFSTLSNYNNLYAGVPSSSRLIYYDGTNSDQTLAAYQARVYPRDVQSVTEMPPFLGLGDGTTDVHLRPDIATQCEAGGIPLNSPVSITTDFDGDARYPNSGYPQSSFIPHSTDIGADEFAGLSIDVAPPAISYSPLKNTINGNARTLTAVITDGSGIPQTGIGLPVLYWKINGGSYQAIQGTYISGDTYSFTFGAGAVVGDVVSYYFVAQDQAIIPNVIAQQPTGASGYSYSPPACTTPPSTPSSYNIVSTISGIFHVGAGKDYTRLTDAAADINAKGLSGPVTLILDDETYFNESFPVTFNPNPGSGIVNTITIKPNTGVTPLIYAGLENSLLILNGIDYLTIDGSNNGSNSQDLTFENYSTSPLASAISLTNNSETDAATNITIKNCILKCRPVNAYTGPAVIYTASTGGGYEDILIDNNLINSGFTGIQLSGNASWPAHNCRITNNIFGSDLETAAISSRGVSLRYADSTLIEGNNIQGPKNGSLNIGQTGVEIGAGSTNTMVRKNRIHDFYHNADDGWGLTGIWYEAGSSTVTEISNNVLYDLKTPGKSPGVGVNILYGIFVRTGGNLKILHNSINLTGPWLSSTYEASSACIGFGDQVSGSNIEVRNNILRNGTVCTGSPNLEGKAYGIMISGGPTMFSVINHNDYYIDGYNGAIAQQFIQGLGIIVDYPSLASWQAFTGQEANSVTVNPVFLADNNLVPTSVPLNNKGEYLPLVPTDYTSTNRSNPCDMGAYEFGGDPVVVTVGSGSVTGVSAVVNGTLNAGNAMGYTFFDYGTSVSYGNSVSGTPETVTGTTAMPFSANLTGLLNNTTYHYRARSLVNGMISYGNDMTFTTTGATPENTTVVGSTGSGISNCFDATNTITVAGGGTVFEVLSGGSATFIAGQKILFLPGTTIHNGGYMHGYITLDGQYCNNPTNPVVSNPESPDGAMAAAPVMTNDATLSVFPNPAQSTFTVELRSAGGQVMNRIEIYTLTGMKAKVAELQGERRYVVSSEDFTPGIYFIHVTTTTGVETLKLIKL